MLVEKINIYSANKPYNPNFNSRFVDYGTPAVLPEHLLEKLAQMRKNYMDIRAFFEQFKNKNSLLASRIRKGYDDLVPKKNESLTFKYDDKRTFTIMCSRKKPQFIWINIDDGSPFNGIVIDGNKLVANYLKNNPHMLPHKIQYMNAERMKAAEPEKFIELASQKVEQYKKYITEFQSGEIRLSRPKAKKRPNPYQQEYWKIFTEEFKKQINAKLQNFHDIIK